jgi:CBS domain-containing protein
MITLTAQDVMTRTVITVSPETRVEDAAGLMAKHRITGLPVLDETGAVVGMISDFDVIGKRGRVVGDIMTTQLVSVSPDTDLDEIGHILSSRHIRRLPVVQAARLVGIITRGDLIKRIAQRWMCNACGFSMHGPRPPAHCENCGADARSLSLEEEPPMMYKDM